MNLDDLDIGIDPALLDLLPGGPAAPKTAFVGGQDMAAAPDPTAAAAGPPIGGMPMGMGTGMGGMGGDVGGMGQSLMGQAHQAATAKPPKVDENAFKLYVLTVLTRIAEAVGVQLSASDVMPAIGAPTLGGGPQGGGMGQMPPDAAMMGQMPPDAAVMGGGVPPDAGPKTASGVSLYQGRASDRSDRPAGGADVVSAALGVLAARQRAAS